MRRSLKTNIRDLMSKGLSVILFLFIFYSSLFGEFTTMVQYGVPIIISFILIFIHFPFSQKGRSKFLEPIFKLSTIMAIIVTVGYSILYYEELVYRIGRIPLFDTAISIIGATLVLEASRRTAGKIFPAVVLFFLAYVLFGNYIPGYFGHPGFSFSRIARYVWLGGDGVFGIATVTMVRFIYMFILFGTFLALIGIDKFAINIAFALFGRMASGPAQAAVISSSLMGTMSGSAVANVATTGAFTIPLMKSKGYRPEFAGAVEAAASSGGQIMPPVMGASAFIMAEILGIPYLKVCIAAAIPAFLFFYAVGIAVHFEAKRVGLMGMEREALPDWRKTIKDGWYLSMPVILLLTLLVLGYTAGRSVILAILFTCAVGIFTKNKSFSPQRLLSAIEEGTKSSLSLFAVCACVGIIIAAVGMAGVGNKFTDVITSLAGQNLMFILILGMISSIILGMGMPTPAAYIIVAIVLTPALIKSSILPIAAHMFAFYFAIISAVTPPVALAAYTGAGIAGANEFRTGIIATKLILPSFIVPFMYIYDPAFLMIGSLIHIVQAFLTALIGITCVAASLGGYLINKVGLLERIVLLCSGVILIVPGMVTDILGLLGVSGVVLKQILARKQKTLRRNA